MSVKHKPRRTEHGIHCLLRFHIADHLQLLRHARARGEDADHLMLCPIKVNQRIHQIHIATAFGIDGHPRLCCTADRGMHRRILRQLSRKHLGKAAADDDPINIGQGFIVQRAERDDLRAVRLEFCKARRIVEGKRLVARHADADGRYSIRPHGRGNGERRGTAGKFQNCVQIQPRLDPLSNGGNRRRRRVLLHGRQSEMALGQSERGVAPQCTVNAQLDALHRRAHHLLMRLAAKTVEEHAREIDRSVIDAKAECRCRRRRSNGFCVNDKEDGCVQRLCNRSRRAYATPPAVIESHNALDDGDVRIRAFAREYFRQTRLRHEPRV